MQRVGLHEHDLGEAEIASVRETLGPRVAEFERTFASYLGVEQVVGVSSCSMGLVLAFEALGVEPGLQRQRLVGLRERGEDHHTATATLVTPRHAAPAAPFFGDALRSMRRRPEVGGPAAGKGGRRRA